LAFSTLVAENSPALTASDKHVMAALFEGQLDVSVPAGGKISVQADSITCSGGTWTSVNILANWSLANKLRR
jgi:hypothetical protein